MNNVKNDEAVTNILLQHFDLVGKKKNFKEGFVSIKLRRN